MFYEKVFKRNEICIQRTNNRRRMFNGGVNDRNKNIVKELQTSFKK